jgi:hypothetical protein
MKAGQAATGGLPVGLALYITIISLSFTCG